MLSVAQERVLFLRHLHLYHACHASLIGIQWLRYLEATDKILRKDLQTAWFDAQAELSVEDRPVWLRKLELALLVPGASTFFVSYTTQQPLLSHVVVYLDQATADENIQFSSRLESSYVRQQFLKKLCDTFVPAGKRKISLTKEQKQAERDAEIQQFLTILRTDPEQAKAVAKWKYVHLGQEMYANVLRTYWKDGFETSQLQDLNENEQDLILAGRLVAGCLRNVIITHMLYGVKEEKRKVELEAQEEQEMKQVMQYLTWTIVLVNILQREKQRLKDLEIMIRTNNYGNEDDIEKLVQHPLLKQYQECQQGIPSWEKQLRSHLLTVLMVFKASNAKLRKALDSSGMSIEQLLKESLEKILNFHLGVSTQKSKVKTFTGRKKTEEKQEAQEVKPKTDYYLERAEAFTYQEQDFVEVVKKGDVIQFTIPEHEQAVSTKLHEPQSLLEKLQKTEGLPPLTEQDIPDIT